MRIAPFPFNEKLRLQDLYAYDVLDSEKEKDFDDLLEVAAHIYECPVAAITFIDQERQWFKSRIGIPENIQETSRDIAFCAHTILDNNVLIVKDASKDERFCRNPFVTNDFGIRFYAGAPIVSAAGYRLGSICVIDQQPRELSQKEAKMLHILSRQISKLLELRLKNRSLRQKAEEQLQVERELLQKILQEHEVEKRSISEELHENIAQTLAATKLCLEIAEAEAGTLNSDLIRKSRESISSLVSQIRELSQTITPSRMDEADLKDLLTTLLSQFHNKSGATVKLLYEGDRSISSGVALGLYRIAESHLQTICRQKATAVTVNVNAFSSLFLSIKDNGVGFEQEAFQKNYSLMNITARVEALNGRAEFTSSLKGGRELTALIPR